MRPLVPLLWLAGAVQIAMLAANFVLPKKLRCREALTSVQPMIREIFVVHWAYIVFVLAAFSALCFGFAPELAGASRLGRFLSAIMAVFWLPRVPIQLFVYDAGIRRQNRLGDVAFLVALSFLGLVFSTAALGVWR